MSDDSTTQMPKNGGFEVLGRVIQRRRTFKVLGDPASPVLIAESRKSVCDQILETALQTSAWAPFHFSRDLDGLAEPWRVDWIETKDCRVIARELRNWFDDVKPSNKLPAMLAACGSLVLISWLPQFETLDDSSEIPKAKQKQIDEEHLAAASAFVQNFLLMLTAAGLGSYWSSGGQFRTAKMFEKLGLEHQGKLLAAIFVDYSENPEDGLERLPGKHRDARCSEFRWLSKVDLSGAE